MIVVNFGGGLNSTALIIEAVKRGIQLDHIICISCWDGDP